MSDLMKTCLSLLIIVTCVVSGSSLGAEDITATPDSETVAAPAATGDLRDGVTINVYYFHGTRRCKTCLAIESNAKAALGKAFAEEMEQNIIIWKAINTDLKENKHYEKEYDLLFSSLILAKVENGKQVEWKNLQKVWELVWDTEAFEEYVQKEIRAYLES